MREGWTYKKLGDICEIITKGTTPTTLGYNFIDDGINFIKIECIGTNRNLIKDKLNYISEECNKSMSRSQLQEKDLLFSIAGALGRIYIVEKSVLPANTNQALSIIRLRDKQDLFLQYLSIFLNSNTIKRQIEKDKVGVAQLNLSLSQVRNFIIPIPPLAEQERIVAELDLLSGIIEKKKEQLKAYDQLAQSIFYTMFGDPIDNPKGWEVKKLKEVSTLINGRAYKQNELLSEGKYKVLRVGNFFTNSNFYYSDLELEDNKYCDNGDLLFAWSASFGAFIWNGGKVIFHYHIWKVLYDEQQLNKIFYRFLLNTMTNAFMNDVHGIGMVHLTKQGMEEYNIPIPPLSLQQEFAEKVEAIERQKALVQQSIEETQTMFDCTMDKYFG